jgi:hypothetical protein
MPWQLSRRLGPVAVPHGGSVLSGLVAFGVGLTRNPWVAGGLLALGGLCVVTFSVILESLRQQFVPDRLLGRVISAFGCSARARCRLALWSAACWPAASACQLRSWWLVWWFRS